MRERITVQLEKRDCVIARKHAKKRLKSFKANPDWDVDKRSFGVGAFDREYTGVMGELAFAKYADLSIDGEEYDRTDGGDDFHVRYEGTPCTIDIKASNKKPYALFVKETEEITADYYIQGHLDDLTVTFFGMATGDKVRAQELVDTPYDHQNHEVPIEELEPIPEPEALKPFGSN